MTLSLESLGFGLSVEETKDRSMLFAVDSPFRMLNGSPFDVFVEEKGGVFHIFDDGLTMHEIISCGVNMSNYHKWDALRKIAEVRNVNLSRTGVFEIYTPIENAEVATANYLRTMFAIDDWLATHAYEIKQADSLVDESKTLFKRWWPSEELIEKPKVDGISGTQLEFDFMIGNRYVDAFVPTAIACGSFLRKVLSISSEIRDKTQTLAVVEDRDNPELARRETKVLSNVSGVIKVSDLARNAANVSLAA